MIFLGYFKHQFYTYKNLCPYLILLSLELWKVLLNSCRFLKPAI